MPTFLEHQPFFTDLFLFIEKSEQPILGIIKKAQTSEGRAVRTM